MAFPQVAEKANEGYKTKEGRESVARRSGGSGSRRDAEAARHRGRDGAEARQCGADVGTGVGFMLPFLSHAVGDKGQVIAEDISSDFLDKAKARAQVLGLTNVEVHPGDRTRIRNFRPIR